jgi:hypothetical protein
MKKNYIIFSSIDWNENWQIHQQLSFALSSDNSRVLFIENTGVRGIKFIDLPRVFKRIKNRLISSGGFKSYNSNITCHSKY